MADPNAPTAATQTPEKAASAAEKRVSWADMVDEMDTMPVEDAKALRPSDIGVRVGPIMDEHQFQEYTRARKNKVRVIRR